MLAGSGFCEELTGTLQAPGQTIGTNDQATTVSGTYSNTADSFTIVSGGSTTFHAVYGTIKKGIAQSASFSGLTTMKGQTTVTCVMHGTLSRN
jgi:hypothetical protein